MSMDAPMGERSPIRVRATAGSHAGVQTALPRFSALAFRAFETVFRPWQARRLMRAPILGLPAALPPDMPLVLVANHVSWWDGFLLRDVQLALRPQAPMYTVMTAHELRRFPFLRLLGATPLDAASRTGTLRMLRSIGAAAAHRPDCVISFFPQGRIRPSWAQPLGFQRGIELLLDSVGPCCVAPVALHVEPLNSIAPTAFISVGPLLLAPDEALSAGYLQDAVAAQLAVIFELLSTHGEDVHSHLRESA
jgi:1-acyl-sn-glycerol-3-phosphate acyltransferase